MHRFGFLLAATLLLALVSATGGAVADDEGAVTLYYEDNAQVELISPAGVRVLIDISNASLLSAPPTEDDILLTTHGHSDHYNKRFVDSFPGQKLTMAAGDLSQDDVEIVSLPSAHNAGDELSAEGATNYLFIIDVAGLRIVHFGDIGQDELTEEQLETLGEVDVAITQFVNSYSHMDLKNMKGFNLMDQVQPRLIVPTHFSSSALDLAAERWTGFVAETWPILIDRSMLVEDETRFLAVGGYVQSAQRRYQWPNWTTAAGD